MFPSSYLEEIILDQIDTFKKRDTGISRDIDFEKYLRTKQIVVISGVRRSGKSTLLHQFSKYYKDFYHINFDDERLINFTVEDFNTLMIIFQKQYESKTIFIDEIQNILNWERFVRRIYDEGYKIFITGSNAKLLSSELGTHLTGRYFKVELYPFSFKEFLQFQNVNYRKMASSTKALVLKHFDWYLKNGGFPEFVKYQDSEFITRAYEDVIYKDIIARFKIREIKSFVELANFLFTNFTSEMSYNSLKNTLGFKSAMSVRNYISFFAQSFLIFELYKYDYSLKKQFVSDKKIYVIDNGMRNAVSFLFSEDTGKLLENLVFLELKRRGAQIYYFKEKKECDFLIREKNKITAALQCAFVLNTNNRERELDGLREALHTFRLTQGSIITHDQEDLITDKDYTIKIIPAWKWLLGIV